MQARQRFGNFQLKLGVSIAASWAWGISLAVGHQILGSKGLIPFFLWTAGNILALTIFGLAIKKYPNYLKLKDNIIIKLSMIIIQFFCIWINTKIISVYSYSWLAIGVVLVVMIATFIGKFRFSFRSDQYQYWIMMIVLVITVFSINMKSISLGLSDYKWGLWGGFALICAPFLDVQHFQRAEKTDSVLPFAIGSLLFGLYMVLVFLSYFAETTKILLVIIVVMIATSTIDSAVASLQYLTSNRIAIVLSLLALSSWWLMNNQSITDIWSFYAGMRIYIVLGLIGWTIKKEENISLLAKLKISKRE